MLTALCVLAALTGGGPLFDLSALTIGVAKYENEYYQILRLRRESQAIPEAERADKARTLGNRVFRVYSSLQYLSFTQQTTNFWCVEGTWRSYLPMEWWPKQPVETSTVAMTPENLHVEVSVAGHRVYSLFSKDVIFREYRWPQRGDSGEYTEYPYNPDFFRLCRGVDPQIRCVVGSLRRPWIGDRTKTSWNRFLQEKGRAKPAQPEHFRRMIGESQWIGSAEEKGERCDVVFSELGDGALGDAFFINAQGFVVLRLRISRDTGENQQTCIVATRYRDLSTEPLQASEFEPTEALRRETEGWRKLSEEEAIQELRQEHGADIQP